MEWQKSLEELIYYRPETPWSQMTGNNLSTVGELNQVYELQLIRNRCVPQEAQAKATPELSIKLRTRKMKTKTGNEYMLRTTSENHSQLTLSQMFGNLLQAFNSDYMYISKKAIIVSF